MRTIEIRRHSCTKKGEGRGAGSHLSQSGVELARRVGEEIGPYHLVLASTIPRATETAIAMGFAVDAVVPMLGEISPEMHEEIGHHERWAWERPFAEFVRLNERGGATARMGQAQVEIWREALESVPEGGRVLVISHGRVIEAGLVAAVSGEDATAWGGPFQHCEGVQLGYDRGCFSNAKILRVEVPFS